MKTFWLSVGILAVSFGLAAQTPLPSGLDGPSFEAVTIRVNNSGGRGSRGNNGRGGRFMLENIPASSLLMTAFGAREPQIVNAPSWTTTERYDINAIGPETATSEVRQSMWRHVLFDRFGLKIHHEQRVLSAANLVLARPDGKLGPHLQRGTAADADCTPPASGPPDFTKGPPPCSMMFSIGQARMRGQTMDRIAMQLTNGMTGISFIFNKTGLDGPFNIDLLEYRPEGLADKPPADWTGPSWPSIDTPSIFTALQEQLGLKLEVIKEPMDVIVVDSIEHPQFD
jgi:uncharacterized protein (TIGR03435 family)